MSFELTILTAATLLGILHIPAASFALMLQQGIDYAVGPRDEERRTTGVAGRLARARANFMETYPIFAALVLIVEFTETAGLLSMWGTSLYLAGRVLYLPLYAWGVPWLRSIVWNVALIGIALVAVEVFV